MTRISFIMPTFNRCDLIGESLQAILAQASDDDEILVVDDGSTDATPAVLATMPPRVRHVRQDNAGKSVALNRGLAMTDGAFVWICDDDDLLRPAVVDRFATRLAGTTAGFIFGRHARFRMDPVAGRIDMGAGYWPDLSAGTLARHLLEDAFVMQNGALVRRACYRDVGPFDERFLRSQDYEMFVRLALRHRGEFVDTIVFDQRKHDGTRGPATGLHAAGQAEDVWRRYDRMIFEANAPLLSTATFEAMFEGADAALVRRAALLQRACVHGRHDMWPEALDDLRTAASTLPQRPLHSVERAICRRMLGGKHGFSGALAPAMSDALRSIHRGGGVGHQIMRTALAGVLWRLRRDEAVVRHDARALLAAVAGPAGSMQHPCRTCHQPRSSTRRPDPAAGALRTGSCRVTAGNLTKGRTTFDRPFTTLDEPVV